MKLEDYLDENSIDNIYNTFSNVFVIRYDVNAIKMGRYVGQLIAKVDMKKDKDYIRVGNYVEFKKNKIKWTNRKICVVDPYWVKNYLDDEKLSVNVKVLKSKVENGKDERTYYLDNETLELNYKQFIQRRLYEDYSQHPHAFLASYRQFQDRRKKVEYYKALNETCKHYLIEHSLLKNVIIPKINNSLKKYKKEWNELLTQELKKDRAKKAINDLIEQNKPVDSKVIKLKK
jgi:hypothetical protein